MQERRPLDGLSFLKAALEANPKQVQFWLSYIDALIQTNRTDTAQAMLAKAHHFGLQGPAFEALTIRIASNLDASEQSVLSNQKSDLTRKQESAKQPGTSPLEYYPTPQEVEAIVLLFNNQQYAEVAAHAEKMTTSFPMDPFSWKSLGAALNQLGRNGDALAPMERAGGTLAERIRRRTAIPVTLSALGDIPAVDSQPRHTIQRLLPKHTITPARHLRGWGGWEANQLPKRAIQINAGYAEALNNLGRPLRS